MKKIIIIALIAISSILLTSCWSNYVKVEDENIKSERLEKTKEYLSIFNTNDNENWKVKITWTWRTLNTKWFNCENIIPFFEYKINGYNDELWYYWEYWEFRKNPWLYDWYLKKYTSYIKVKFNEKDKEWTCVYNLYYSDNEWNIHDTDNWGEKVYAKYKDGVLEYKIYSELEWVDIVEDYYKPYKKDYFRMNILEEGFTLNHKNSFKDYIDYLLSLIDYVEWNEDRYSDINSKWIIIK